MNDEEYFLYLAEKLSGLLAEEQSLLARAREAESTGDAVVASEVAERINLNRTKRRLVLKRIQELAQPSAR